MVFSTSQLCILPPKAGTARTGWLSAGLGVASPARAIWVTRGVAPSATQPANYTTLRSVNCQCNKNAPGGRGQSQVCVYSGSQIKPGPKPGRETPLTRSGRRAEPRRKISCFEVQGRCARATSGKRYSGPQRASTRPLAFENDSHSKMNASMTSTFTSCCFSGSA
jgi:hypothetical protein